MRYAFDPRRSRVESLVVPFAFLGSVPGGALVPALLLGLWVRSRWPNLGRSRRTVAGGAVLLWFIYAAYETRMYFWMRSVIAPIRVDLLLIAPTLVFATLAAIAVCLGRSGGDRGPRSAQGDR